MNLLKISDLQKCGDNWQHRKKDILFPRIAVGNTERAKQL